MLSENEASIRSDVTSDLQALLGDSKAVQVLDDNTLSFSSDIDTNSANELIEAAYEMDKALGCETLPIRLLFSTNGGDVNEAMRIINVLKYGLRRPVFIYATGYVYSAGVSILASLENRFAFPYTFFMIHSIRLNLNESVSLQSLKASQNALFILEQRMNQMLFDIGAFTQEELTDKTIKGDYMFSVDEALERGLINKIISSADFDKKVKCFEEVDNGKEIEHNDKGE